MPDDQIHLGDIAVCEHCGMRREYCQCSFLTVQAIAPFNLMEYYRRLAMSPWN